MPTMPLTVISAWEDLLECSVKKNSCYFVRILYISLPIIRLFEIMCIDTDIWSLAKVTTTHISVPEYEDLKGVLTSCNI